MLPSLSACTVRLRRITTPLLIGKSSIFAKNGKRELRVDRGKKGSKKSGTVQKSRYYKSSQRCLYCCIFRKGSPEWVLLHC